MEASVDKQLGSGQLGRKIKLAPDLFRARGKHRLGTRLIAVQVAGNFENTVEVFAGTAVLAMFLGFAQCLADKVLGENGFFLVRLVLRGAGLKVKAQGATVSIGLECGQLSDILAGN